MARLFIIAVCVALFAVVVSAQFDYFGGFGGAPAPRDPRDSRGPVTFPVTQPGSETSGVRVGASGYGFIPPGQRGGKKQTTVWHRDNNFNWKAEDFEHLFRYNYPKATDFTGGFQPSSRYQMAKESELADIENLLNRAMEQRETAQQETEAEADIHKRGLEEQAQDSLDQTQALAERSMRDAEKRILLIMTKWKLGGKKT